MTAPYRNLPDVSGSGKDKKWDYDEQMAKLKTDDYEIKIKKELARLLMAELEDRKEGKVVPDTIGADYYFLTSS